MSFFLTITTLLLFFWPSVAFRSNQYNNKNAVLLSDVKTLTLHQNKMTTGRRGSPLPQLVCIGGNAQREAQKEVDTIQCYNQGSDGRSIQWKCETSFKSPGLRLGRVEVGCEGYESSDDEFILVGSCNLEYELVRTSPPPQQKKTTTTTTKNHQIPVVNNHRKQDYGGWEPMGLGFFLAFLFFVFICAVILVYLIRSCDRNESNHRPYSTYIPKNDVVVVEQNPKVNYRKQTKTPIVVQQPTPVIIQQPTPIIINQSSSSYTDGFITGSLMSGNRNYQRHDSGWFDYSPCTTTTVSEETTTYNYSNDDNDSYKSTAYGGTKNR